MAVTLDDICDTERLERLVADGYITAREDPDSDLVIYNYTPVAQYSRDAFAIPEVRLARGLVVDVEQRIVARSFTKFGGIGEYDDQGNSVYGPLPVDEPAVIAEKLDGSLGVVFRHNGRLRVSTRGSFTSPQAQWAQHWLDTHIEDDTLTDIDGETTTLCVEILSPESRIVVRYDRDELVALGAVNHTDGRTVPIPEDWPARRVTTYPELAVADVWKCAGTDPDGSANREGYVIHFPGSDTRVKVKFGEYLRLHRLYAGLTRHTVWEHWAMALLAESDSRSGARALRMTVDEYQQRCQHTDPIAYLLGAVPDEALGLVRAELADLDHRHREARNELDTIIAALNGVERRDVAATVGKSPYLPAVFEHLNGANVDTHLVRIVEPPAEPLN